jgi:hypothetical protein
MSVEQLANLAQTTLSAAITSTTATSCTVTSATLFPATGNFRILIDAEIMIVTAVSSTTFTISRGQEGTTAATHTNGATVTCILTAGSVKQVVQDSHSTWCGYFTSADQPTTGSTWVFTWTATYDDGYLANGTQFVVPTTGFYLFCGYVHWAASSLGIRVLEWRYNGSTLLNGCANEPSVDTAVDDTRQNATILFYMNAGDFFELTAFQNEGTNNNPVYVGASVMQVKTTA